MTTSSSEATERVADRDGDGAARHLWMHFTKMSAFADGPVPTIERGEGAAIFDTHGKRYLDMLSGLFVVQAGHGRAELAEVAAAQAPQTRLFPGLVLRASGRPGVGRPARCAGAGRSEPRVLLLRRR